MNILLTLKRSKRRQRDFSTLFVQDHVRPNRNISHQDRHNFKKKDIQTRVQIRMDLHKA